MSTWQIRRLRLSRLIPAGHRASDPAGQYDLPGHYQSMFQDPAVREMASLSSWKTFIDLQRQSQRRRRAL